MVDAQGRPASPKSRLAAALLAFRLSIISNRGTQVWPTGSVYTECVDYYRVRFELKDGVSPGSFGQSRCVVCWSAAACPTM